MIRKLILLVSERGLGMIASLGTRALEAVSKFGLYALAAHMLGGAASGGFFLCLSLVHFLCTFARMGLEKPLTRHVAAEMAIGDEAAARRKAMSGIMAVMIVSLVVAAIVAAAAGPIAAGVFRQPELETALRISAILVPVQNLAWVLAYVLIGLDRGVVAQMVMNALVPTLSLIALLLGARDLHSLLIVYVAAFAICGAIGLAAIRHYWHRARMEPHPAEQAEALPSLWRSARPLFVVELGLAGLLSLPVLALGRFASPVDVSEFSIASRLSMLVSIVVLSIGTIVAPAFARHYRRGEIAELRAVNRQARVMSMLICLPMIAVIVIGADPLLTLLGSASPTSIRVLWILIFGQLLFSMLPCQDILLAMTGHGDVLRRLMLAQIVACVAICAILIPPFGSIGAALASMAAWSINAVGCALAVRRFLPEMAGTRANSITA